MTRELEILATQIRSNLQRSDVDLMTPSELLEEIAACIDDTVSIIEAQDLVPRETTDG